MACQLNVGIAILNYLPHPCGDGDPSLKTICAVLRAPALFSPHHGWRIRFSASPAASRTIGLAYTQVE
ncbi:MAG: hypothetical protein WCI88_13585 [Chloroflexota bacterium]